MSIPRFRLHPVPGYGVTVVGMTNGWAPRACTLPTAERPVREAEFADLIAGAAVERVGPTGLRLRLAPEVAARAAALMVKETACCSFFTFALVADGSGVTLTITVPAAHSAVLDALEGAGGRRA